jgi:hypothetical protein
MRQGLPTPILESSGNRRSGMKAIELRRKLRAFDKGGLIFRLLAR